MNKKIAQKTNATDAVAKVVSTKKPNKEWDNKQLKIVANNCKTVVSLKAQGEEVTKAVKEIANSNMYIMLLHYKNHINKNGVVSRTAITTTNNILTTYGLTKTQVNRINQVSTHKKAQQLINDCDTVEEVSKLLLKTSFIHVDKKNNEKEVKAIASQTDMRNYCKETSGTQIDSEIVEITEKQSRIYFELFDIDGLTNDQKKEYYNELLIENQIRYNKTKNVK
jgi:hypothetical protein